MAAVHSRPTSTIDPIPDLEQRQGPRDKRSATATITAADLGVEGACRATVSEPPDPTSTFDVVGLDHTGPWDYTSDGQTTTIPNADFVVTNRTVHAQPTQEVQVHIAAVDGQERWFTECTPG